MNAPLKAIEGQSKVQANVAAAMREIGREARAAAHVLALAPAKQKDRALAAMAKAIRHSRATILAANAEDQAEAKAAGMNSQMFNSFLDGTKSAIEMAAVANACALDVPHDGLHFPPCGAEELAGVLRPKTLGGVIERDGMVEVVSSLKRDGSPVERDLRWGVYVVFKAPTEYAAACFKQYGLPTDSTGRYAAMYKPYHLIGLELSISVLNMALRGEPTGTCRGFRGDAVAVAKRALKAGEMLDGEGGYTVYAKLIPAARSLTLGALPIGLAHHVRLVRDVAAGEFLTSADVALDDLRHDNLAQAVRIRRDMEMQARQVGKILAAE